MVVTSLLTPAVRIDTLLTFRAPNSPESVGDGNYIKLFYEGSHEQHKDNYEVEDIPAILQGGAAQKGLSSPAHGSTLSACHNGRLYVPLRTKLASCHLLAVTPNML